MTAIDALNGKEHMGRVLTVNEAKPREPRQGGFRPRRDREDRRPRTEE